MHRSDGSLPRVEVAKATDEFDRVFGDTSDAVFVVGADYRIEWWGPRAEELLGLSASQVLGRRCFEVVQGLHLGGRARCTAGCWVMQAARLGRSVAPFPLELREDRGRSRCYSVGFMTGSSGEHLVHVLRPRDRPSPDADRPPAPRCPTDPRAVRVTQLTAREREVLLLVAAGLSSRAIASQLSISHATARNHVQNVLAKLGVHNKIDAALAAVHAGLGSHPGEGEVAHLS